MRIGVLGCLALLLLQAPEAPPKSGSIEGFVRRVGTGEPVFNARVMITGVPKPVYVYTEKDGHFAFKDLAPGKYTLVAFANSYVRMSYGQKAQNVPPTPVVVAAGEQVKDIVFELTPTAMVTGRIYDFDNLPLAGVDVELQKATYDQYGQRTLQTIHQARTNDLGEYRLYWISPGRYFLRVEFADAGVSYGRNPNEFVDPIVDGYAPTYYPGTPDPSSASAIDLLPGAQFSSIDVNLIKTKSYTLRGRAIVNASDPTLFRVSAVVMWRRGQLPFGNRISTNVNSDGTFEFHNVFAGSYVLQAAVGSGSAAMRAQRTLDVNGDMEDVVITLNPGFDVPCRIVFDGQPPAPGSTPTPITSMRALLQDRGIAFGQLILTNPGLVKADGTFTLTNVIPGTYQILLQSLPSADFYIKAIRFGGRDALPEGLLLDHTPELPIEILLSPNAGSLTGTLVDKDGNRVPSTRVMLIPSERTLIDRFKSAVTEQDGTFTLRGIYPGNYKLFAWEMIEPNAERDPDFLRQYEELGKPAAITEGSNPSVELRLIKLP